MSANFVLPLLGFECCEQTAPDRVEVRTGDQCLVATYTRGAYTVTSAGPNRLFTERTAADPVGHTTWVRTLPRPFDGQIDEIWLAHALHANQFRVPDVLGIAMQYVEGAPPLFWGELQVAGQAAYGPLTSKGRQEGADFCDYPGMVWTYPDGTIDKPEASQRLCLDCSGLVRMIFGFRSNLPVGGYPGCIPLLPIEPKSFDGLSIPRRARQICTHGPGVLLAASTPAQITDFSHLNVGDLVLFDTDESEQGADHVGVYVGQDGAKHHRFLSSRKTPNRPTMGDVGARSILDGDGLYATHFCAIRRL